MPRSRLLVPAALAVALVLAGCVPEPEVARPPTGRPFVTPTPSASPTRTATPAPTPTRIEPVLISCDTITTDAFRSLMMQTGWISWETQNDQLGAKPFALFPNGSPDGQIICRWGLSPDLVTDNVYDLAWAPIDSENAVAARQALEARGFTTIDAPEGIYVASRSGGDRADAEGWGATYLFTFDDVRWAPTKADIAYITAPGAAG